MYIVVIGAGKVGYYLGKELLEQGHEVLLVERDPEKVSKITETLGNIGLLGDGCELAVLSEAGVSRCDVLVAVTGDDEDNLVACQLGKVHFQVPRAIARVNNPKNERIFRSLGIDVTVSATNVLMSLIEHEMPQRALLHLLEIRQRGIEIVEMQLPPDSPAVGKKVSDLSLPQNSSIVVVLRGESFLIPSGQLVLQEGDEVIALCRTMQEGDLRDALLGPE